MFMLILPDNLQAIIDTKKPWELTQGDLKALAHACIQHYDAVGEHPNGNYEECEQITQTWYVLGFHLADLFYGEPSYKDARELKDEDQIGESLWDQLPDYAQKEVLDLYEV